MIQVVQHFRSQIKYKIILPYLVLVILVMLVGAGITVYLVASSYQERFNNQLGQVGRNFADALAQQEQANTDFLWQVAFAQENPEGNAPPVAVAMENDNIEGLAAALQPFYDLAALPNNTFGVVLDRFIAFDLQGASLVHWERVTNPQNLDAISIHNEHAATDLSQLQLVQRVLAGEIDEVGDKYAALIRFQDVEDAANAFADDDYYFFTVVPVRNDNEDIIGGLLLATRLENMLSTLERESQSEVTAMYDITGRALNSTALPGDGLVALDMSVELAERLVGQLSDAEAYAECFVEESPGFAMLPLGESRPACSILDEVPINERDFQFLYGPLVIRQAQVGYFSVGLSSDFVTEPLTDSRNAIIAMTILLAIGAIWLGYWIVQQITEPLEELMETAEAVTQGDLARRSLVTEGNELGTLGQSFNTMIDSLLELTGALQIETNKRAAVEGITEAVYQALTQGLSVEEITDISAYTRPKLPTDVPHLIPANLDAVLAEFETISANVRKYIAATSPTTQRNTLLRANENLNVLAQQVQGLPEPFNSLLSFVVARWRQVLVEEGGKLARAQMVGPIANPYVAGNPVQGSLFVGREDILRRLEALWTKEGQVSSVILFGHRRMGKSSILRNLSEHVDAQTAIVDFNMQRVGWVESTGEIFYNLALELYDKLSIAQQSELSEPDEQRFLDHNPYTTFDRFLKQLDSVRGDLRFIVTIDEFELIEALIARDILEPYFLDYCRGLIQSYPWFVVAFAGLHTLEEMRHDYWHPLFGSVTAIPVSFLSPEGARRLITQPSPDFDIDYDADAVARIVELTHGQPYLVQLVGHALVTRFNRQTFEEGRERARRFSLDDVTAVIDAPEFFRDGNAYFSGVWSQAEESAPPGQTAVLRALGPAQAGMALAELSAATGLDREQVCAALDTLQRHDVVAEHANGYRYTVELMRRWVAMTR